MTGPIVRPKRYSFQHNQVVSISQRRFKQNAPLPALKTRFIGYTFSVRV